jgi:hypothetical protein
MLPFLWHDLILLENQVPWMVLENLFKLTKDSNRDMPLIVVTTIFLENNLLHKATHVTIESWLTTPRNSCQSIMNIEGIEHFLDLLRKLLTLFTKETKECIGEYEWEVLPSATRLVEAGIKFKRGAYGSILDIKFIDRWHSRNSSITDSRRNRNWLSKSYQL